MPSNEYFAGFFDGEGFVSITNGGRVQVGVTQKHPDILYELKNVFGGNVFVHDRKFNNCHHWKVTDKRGIKNFLNSVYPFSVVKKKEIELGLKAVELIRENNLGCNPLHSDDWIKRLAIRQEMQDLRPKKMFRNLMSEESRYRDEIKTKYQYRCSKCDAYLKNVSPVYQIIRDDKLICRGCNARMNIKEIKPLTKSQIEDVLKRSLSLNEACKELGLNRSSLYKKRKRFGLPLRIGFRGNYHNSKLEPNPPTRVDIS
jgi:DNA-directed RNA polymerase subunit RPC12/RpoP